MGKRLGDIEQVRLTRDCEAVVVPWGNSSPLRAGSVVQITQQLGGNFTVMSGGNLYRIAGADADALGIELESETTSAEASSDAAQAHRASAASASADSVEAAAWRELATCFDPEIPIDIVNLGLVYLCQAIPLADGGFRLDVKMTLTAPGCGMGMVIADEAREKLIGIPAVEEVDIDLVWNPPWSREMMSEAARLEMGLF